MIIYTSTPYALYDPISQKDARMHLLRVIGKMRAANPKNTYVNALLSLERDTVATIGVVPAFASLLSVSRSITVIRAPGWEYSPVVHDEVLMAQNLGLSVCYIDL